MGSELPCGSAAEGAQRNHERSAAPDGRSQPEADMICAAAAQKLISRRAKEVILLFSENAAQYEYESAAVHIALSKLVCIASFQVLKRKRLN